MVDQGNGIGMAWDQGPLEHGKRICSSSSPIEVLRNQTNGKNEKTAKKEKAAKTRVSQKL